MAQSRVSDGDTVNGKRSRSKVSSQLRSARGATLRLTVNVIDHDFRTVVRIPSNATVADFHAKLSARWPTLNLRWRDLVSSAADDTPLSRCGVCDGDQVDVAVNDLSVSVWKDGRRLADHQCSGRVAGGFTFVNVADWVGLTLGEREGAVFECQGCGRKLRKEEEEFQRIPAACCRVRSLRLQLRMSSADVGVQTSSSRCRRDKGTQVLRPEKDVGVQVGSTSETQESTFECGDRVPLHIHIPSCSSQWILPKQSDTLGSVLQQLRRNGRFLLQITNIRHGRKSLKSSGNSVWLRRSVGDHNLHPGDSLQLDVAPSAPVNLIALSVTMDGAWAVNPGPGEFEWRNLISRAKRLIGDRVEQATVAQEGVFYQASGQRRRAVLSYDIQNKKYEFRDEMDGQEVKDDKVTAGVVEFLSPSTPIRAAPGHSPVVKIFVTSKLMVVADTKSGPRLQDTDSASVLDPDFLLHLSGLEMKDGQTGKKRFLARLSDNSLGDCTTGKVFLTAEEAARAQNLNPADQSWTRVLVLFRDEDPMPKWKLPGQARCKVFIRDTVILDVQAGRLRREGGEAGPWILPKGEAAASLESMVARGIEMSVKRAQWLH